MTSITVNNPFASEQITTDDPKQQEWQLDVARQFKAAATMGVLMSLGAHELRAVPGVHTLGGLFFIARILPMTKNGRGSRPALMAVMVSVTGIDEIDIDVRRLRDGVEHATVRGIYIDQLAAALLALDYDGPEIFNPSYWSN